MNLFSWGPTALSSGVISDFKIECDALTDRDWACLANLASQKIKFSRAIPVPTGGNRFADYLNLHADMGPVLICDDVLTTGNSMEKIRACVKNSDVIGVVVFARGKCPDWITPIFTM